MKKKELVLLFCQLLILFLGYFSVWKDSIILLGVIFIIIQYVSSLHLLGWISAIAYPITYIVASWCDTPIYGVPNNLYVYWYLSYITLILSTLIIELILRYKRNSNTPTDSDLS